MATILTSPTAFSLASTASTLQDSFVRASRSNPQDKVEPQIESDIGIIVIGFIFPGSKDLNKTFIYVVFMDFHNEVPKVPLINLVKRVIRDCLRVSVLISFSLCECSLPYVIC